MTTVFSSVFNQQLFATPSRHTTDKAAAVEGFSQIFASMLSKGLRQGALGTDSGMMGTQGGATGDIYGGLFDQAISKVLSRSPAMKPLNDMVSRELGAASKEKPAPGIKSATSRRVAAKSVIEPISYTEAGSPVASAPVISGGAVNPTATDDRGPLLLPPPPSAFGPVLPPPTTLTEG